MTEAFPESKHISRKLQMTQIVKAVQCSVRPESSLKSKGSHFSMLIWSFFLSFPPSPPFFPLLLLSLTGRWLLMLQNSFPQLGSLKGCVYCPPQENYSYLWWIKGSNQHVAFSQKLTLSSVIFWELWDIINWNTEMQILRHWETRSLLGKGLLDITKDTMSSNQLALPPGSGLYPSCWHYW